MSKTSLYSDSDLGPDPKEVEPFPLNTYDMRKAALCNNAKAHQKRRDLIKKRAKYYSFADSRIRELDDSRFLLFAYYNDLVRESRMLKHDDPKYQSPNEEMVRLPEG
jgi:hypothetical protein